MKLRARRRPTLRDPFHLPPRFAAGGGKAKAWLTHWRRLASLDPREMHHVEVGRWEGIRFIETSEHHIAPGIAP